MLSRFAQSPFVWGAFRVTIGRWLLATCLGPFVALTPIVVLLPVFPAALLVLYFLFPFAPALTVGALQAYALRERSPHAWIWAVATAAGLSASLVTVFGHLVLAGRSALLAPDLSILDRIVVYGLGGVSYAFSVGLAFALVPLLDRRARARDAERAQPFGS